MTDRPPGAQHTWKFFRSGGLDQVLLRNADDLRSLAQLDQKLWVALSCPVKGLELDEKTLALVDADGDGHVRVPEVIAAVNWASARLKDPALLLNGDDPLPLAAIGDATDEGKILLASARRILANLARSGAEAISVAEASDTATIFSAGALHGDGILLPKASEDPAVQALIQEVIACVGGIADRNGAIGATADQIAKFFEEVTAYAAWIDQSAAKEIAILGDATDAAVGALRAVRAKADDYFTRCRLASFDGRATAALNRTEADYAAIAGKELAPAALEVAAFPLARVEPARPLPLGEGINPAWAGAVETLRLKAIAPVLGADAIALTEADWHTLNAAFGPYETWLGGKPVSAVEKLGVDRIRSILAGSERAALLQLVEREKALEPEFKAISDVERLVRYHRDLRTLLHNFVNFADFYSRDRWAVFQAGTLYLDSRSTEFCVRVEGPNPLAAMSKAYLAYCQCTRAGAPTLTIAAGFTQGDSDYLFVGRHGVFYDRQGRDWDALITSIIDNPISLRAAVLSPYKKFIRLIEEQVAKRAAAAESASDAKLAAAAAATANADQTAPPPAPVAAAAPAPAVPPKKIDVGTVAAIGVAVGAIGGFLTSAAGYAIGVVNGGPLMILCALIGILILISGPSVFIAWLKLRQRTLGPLLDGNGWAVNGRVKINIPFGTALTDRAELPPGSLRTLKDPYEDKKAAAHRRQLIALIVLLIAAAIAWKMRDRWWPRVETALGLAPPRAVAAPAPAAGTGSPAGTPVSGAPSTPATSTAPSAR